MKAAVFIVIITVCMAVFFGAGIASSGTALIKSRAATIDAAVAAN